MKYTKNIFGTNFVIHKTNNLGFSTFKSPEHYVRIKVLD